jgi:hypothetical protein
MLFRSIVMGGVAMKTLVSASVFGLIPIPPTDVIGSGDDRQAIREKIDRSASHPIAKRMATQAELARKREDLGELGAKRCDMWRSCFFALVRRHHLR